MATRYGPHKVKCVDFVPIPPLGKPEEEARIFDVYITAEKGEELNAALLELKKTVMSRNNFDTELWEAYFLKCDHALKMHQTYNEKLKIGTCLLVIDESDAKATARDGGSMRKKLDYSDRAAVALYFEGIRQMLERKGLTLDNAFSFILKRNDV